MLGWWTYRFITLLFAAALAGLVDLLAAWALEVEADVPVGEGDRVSMVLVCTREIVGGCVGSREEVALPWMPVSRPRLLVHN